MPAAKGPKPPAPSQTKNIAPFGDPEVDGVLSGIAWSSTTDVTTVTYSFPNSYTDYGKGYPEAGAKKFVALNPAEQAAAISVFALVEQYARLDFVDKTGSEDASAQIRLGNTFTQGADAWAYYPGSGKGGDVWFDSKTGSSGLMRHTAPDLQPGDYTYTVYMHEIGHALGLKHSFENTSFGVVPIDSLEYTVMSYDAYVGAPNTWADDGNNPYTFMMYDIAALQYMYGANYQTNAGDTTYSWNPLTGAMTVVNGNAATTYFAADDGSSVVFLTVWDGAGNDTYDFGNYTTNLSVDLRPGGWTALDTDPADGYAQRADLDAGQGVHWAAGNIANALVFDFNDDASGAGLIENAIGGSGDDVIIGNDVANILSGGAGNDSLTGGAGDDIFLFNAPLAILGIDQILDFGDGDMIWFEDAVFGALGATEALSADAFWIGAAAADAEDRVVYNDANGALYYDADGSDSGAAIQIATLQLTPILNVNDFLIV